MREIINKKSFQGLIVVSFILLGVGIIGVLSINQQESRGIMFCCPTTEGPWKCNFSTFLGGSADEKAATDAALDVASITADKDGNVIIVGRTSSNDFPTLNAYQSNHAGGTLDAIVAKFNSTGALLFSTYLGGSGEDWAARVTTDSSDNIVIVGTTTSSNFPTSNPYQDSHGGGVTYGTDAFLVKLSSTGQSLLYSTYFGGTNDDWGYGVDVDSEGNFAITGSTYSANLPTTNAFQETTGGGGVDGYVVKFTSNGQSINFCTYFGGSTNDWGADLVFDTGGNIVIGGGTMGSDFPDSNAFQDTYGGGTMDCIVVKFSTSGSLLFSTFFGDDQTDRGYGIAVDHENDIIVVGETSSPSFYTVNAYNETISGEEDAFVSKLSSDGQSLIFSTFLGADDTEHATCVDINSKNEIVVIGQTDSESFPVYKACQDFHAGYTDVFMTQFNENGSMMVSTLFGGSSTDLGRGVAIDASDNIVITGYTYSNDLPVSNAYQEEKDKWFDMFAFSITYDESIAETTATMPTTTSPTQASEPTTTAAIGTSESTPTTQPTGAPGFELILFPLIFAIIGILKQGKKHD